jgi:hypothetical protein
VAGTSADATVQPITGSYLADLGALLAGHSLGNSGKVGEQMVFALLRVLRLRPFVDQYKDLVTFLETALDREPPLLHHFDGFSDQYLCRMINGQPHKTAIDELSRIKMPELREDNDSDWITVTHPLQELHIQGHSQGPYSDCMPLVPTYRGCLQSKEDAVYLIEACLCGKLVHSCRGPRDGEATISGNIFVWEANSTGIDCWRDKME